jgi:putative sterol carrier protein
MSSEPEAQEAAQNGQVEGVDLSSVDPDQVTQAVAAATDEQLREGMKGPMRKQIIDEVFSRMKEHFKPAGAQGVNAVVHWKITGGDGDAVDQREVVIKDGAISVTDEPKETARVTLTMDGVDFLRLVTGGVQGPTLFMSGKLKIEGDLMFSANIQSMFTIPTSAPPPGPVPPAPSA